MIRVFVSAAKVQSNARDGVEEPVFIVYDHDDERYTAADVVIHGVACMVYAPVPERVWPGAREGVRAWVETEGPVTLDGTRVLTTVAP